MPLVLPDNLAAPYFISATDDHKLDGATLLPGQTVAVTSSDPTTVVLTPDATPKPAPDGSPSIASGMAAAANPVGKANTPVALTSHISNSDGTPGKDANGNVIADASDTISVAPGTVAAQGVLFGVPAAALAVAPATAAQRVAKTV